MGVAGVGCRDVAAVAVVVRRTFAAVAGRADEGVAFAFAVADGVVGRVGGRACALADAVVVGVFGSEPYARSHQTAGARSGYVGAERDVAVVGAVCR